MVPGASNSAIADVSFRQRSALMRAKIVDSIVLSLVQENRHHTLANGKRFAAAFFNITYLSNCYVGCWLRLVRKKWKVLFVAQRDFSTLWTTRRIEKGYLFQII